MDPEIDAEARLATMRIMIIDGTAIGMYNVVALDPSENIAAYADLTYGYVST